MALILPLSSYLPFWSSQFYSRTTVTYKALLPVRTSRILSSLDLLFYSHISGEACLRTVTLSRNEFTNFHVCLVLPLFSYYSTGSSRYLTDSAAIGEAMPKHWQLLYSLLLISTSSISQQVRRRASHAGMHINKILRVLELIIMFSHLCK